MEPPSQYTQEASGGSDRPGGYFHFRSIGHLIVWPSLIFFLTSSAFVFFMHSSQFLVFTVVGICVVVSALLMLVPQKRPNAPAYWFNAGIFCLAATILGSASGMWNYNRNIGLFWAYDGQREYTNVRPDEPALTHLDAGKIQFSSDARVDLSKAAAYSGHRVYCAAPVVGSSSPNPIEYWAAGVGCCESSGSDFTCGKVDNSDAHAGLVYLDVGALDSPSLENLRKAAKAVEDKYGITGSQDALFVHWVVDPSKAAWLFHNAGIGFLIGSSAVYLGTSTLLGLMMHFGATRIRTPGFLKTR